ncbi:hypothetical protein AVEN_137460-1 [Araneus ventricosus]|uniref:Uncharacterized protein n=1 Tax=Araneus ventricosus TaxID=182803 RepID=A0A4Y2LW88_ARAVE|nr:hypothetical protein AVEN_137460-1 [Araneus ventricosus]
MMKYHVPIVNSRFGSRLLVQTKHPQRPISNLQPKNTAYYLDKLNMRGYPIRFLWGSNQDLGLARSKLTPTMLDRSHGDVNPIENSL